jgi:hypothetical protein
LDEIVHRDYVQVPDTPWGSSGLTGLLIRSPDVLVDRGSGCLG